MDLSCLSPITIPNPHFGYDPRGTPWNKLQTRFIQVPCGKCPACIVRKKNEWTNRLLLESCLYPLNLFVTLTYDEINEPYIESEEYGFVPVHRYSDFQGFLKRLRSRLAYSGAGNIRFFVCSEYSPLNFRSHYHAILFGYPEGRNPLEDILVSWNKGIECTVYPLRDGGSSYCCKYLFKQQTYLSGQCPNFMHCSQRPPIGFASLTDRQVQFLIDNNSDVYNSSKTGKITLPRSFKDKIFDRDVLSKISEKKINEFNDKIEAEISRLASIKGNEHEAHLYLAEYRRQRWLSLERSIYNTTHKRKNNKIL